MADKTAAHKLTKRRKICKSEETKSINNYEVKAFTVDLYVKKEQKNLEKADNLQWMEGIRKLNQSVINT